MKKVFYTLTFAVSLLVLFMPAQAQTADVGFDDAIILSIGFFPPVEAGVSVVQTRQDVASATDNVETNHSTANDSDFVKWSGNGTTNPVNTWQYNGRGESVNGMFVNLFG